MLGEVVGEVVDAVDDGTPIVEVVFPTTLVHWTSEGMVASLERVRSAHWKKWSGTIGQMDVEK